MLPMTINERELSSEKPSIKRVTFDLDNIQIETISDHSSTCSSSYSISEPSTPSLPPIRNIERISKRESYDALQKRQEMRRYYQPGYWYPSSSPVTQQPQRSIEYTEQLINEIIRREMALHPQLFSVYTSKEKKRLFFIRIVKAESLDLPIEKATDEAYVYCSLRYKDLETKSHKQKLSHTVNIEYHETRIEQIDPKEQIILTLHIERPPSKKMSWYHRIRPNKKTQGDLDRYVNPKDGSICQTVFSTSRFMDSKNISTATLLLVNNWYRSNHPTMMNKAVMEKAIGKIYIEYLCFTYDSTQYHNIPNTMKEANDIIHQR